MVDSKKVKELLFSLGADLCGIAGIDRFAEAPEGFRPTDILPTCKSVIVFACRFPVSTLICNTDEAYKRAGSLVNSKVDRIAIDFCIEMEKQKVICVPIPTNEYDYDESLGRFHSVLSCKHAAQAAGLGRIARHTMLLTPEFGSMVTLDVILCEQELEPDELKEDICINCDLCVKVCPVNALKLTEMDQQACKYHNAVLRRDNKLGCHKCRDICPYNFGSQNSIFDRARVKI